MLFAENWMQLEIIILSDIRHRKAILTTFGSYNLPVLSEIISEPRRKV